MRFALLWAIVAGLAALAIGRHIPRGAFANISHSNPFPDTEDTPTPLDTRVVPNSTCKDGAIDNDNAEDDSVEGLADSPPESLADSASDELWYKHIRKGNSLNCGMCGTDMGAGYQAGDTRTPPSAASRWVGGVVELVDWYWWESWYESSVCDMDIYWGMGSMFQALGINPRPTTAGGDQQCFQLKHSNENAKYPDGKPKEVLTQSYVVEGKMYHATDASHYFSMDIRAGVIVGIALLGPHIAAERLWGWKPTPDQLPKLRNLSDLYWAYWSSLHNAAGMRVDNLNKYIVNSVQNPETDQIISRALRSRGTEELELWPGQYFPVESTQGLALLGSPIGATVGFLLMQHKRELGNKYVSGVRILRNDDQADGTNQGADLVFYITDVPPEKQIPDAPGQEPPQGRPQSDALATLAFRNLSERAVSTNPVEEHVLGPQSILRVHMIVAR